MKKTDIAAVILISVLTTVVAYLIGNSVLGDPNDESVKITYMDVVSSEVSSPDTEVFNTEAVNPTVEVFVGNCADGEIWDAQNQVCISTEEEDPDDENNSETDADNSETGE